MKISINNLTKRKETDITDFLEEEVWSNISPYILKRYSLLLAFSGGIDSTVLLDILCELRKKKIAEFGKEMLKFRSIHIHHGWSNQANDWVNHCVEECKKKKVEINVVRMFFDNTHSKNIEERLREGRYLAFSHAIKENEFLCIAQNKNDQVETFFLALKRGSGPSGLSSMKKNNFIGYHITRPILEVSREEIKEYAKKRGLHWIEDESNRDLKFDRNFLRHQILISMQKRWPSFINSVYRSTQVCDEQEKLLDELLKNTISSCIHSDGSLQISKISNMTRIHRIAILRRWILLNNIRYPSRKKMHLLWEEVALSKRDSIAEIRIDKDKKIRRFQDRLYFVENDVILHQNEKTIFQKSERMFELPKKLGIILFQKYSEISKKKIMIRLQDLSALLYLIHEKKIKSKNEIFFKDFFPFHKKEIFRIRKMVTEVRAPLAQEKISIRFDSKKKYLHILGRNRRRSLKKIWQEMKIPPWRRKHIPLLFYNETLIAALGIFITKDGQAQDQQNKYRFCWYCKEIETNFSSLKRESSLFNLPTTGTNRLIFSEDVSDKIRNF